MTHHLLIVAAIAIALIGGPGLGLAQNTLPKRTPPLEIDLLAMDGSSTKLSDHGEGVVAVKSSLLFKLGPTRVSKVDPALKLNLPPGYKLFGNLAFAVESEAVVTGPHAVTLNLPSVASKDVFGTLRILHAVRNDAAPDQPRWSDKTVVTDYYPHIENFFTKAEFEKLLPDFATHTLRAVSDQLGVFVVAIKDSSVARDRFVADLGVTATSKPNAVLEGRELEYSYRIQNDGPDSATGVRFHSYFEPAFLSVSASQGTCRYEAGNIYCSLGEVAKGANATVVVKATSRFGSGANSPGEQSERTEFDVGAAEGDPNYENNMRLLVTEVLPDSNKPPEVEIVSPSVRQLFVGPAASVNIIAEAHDPDGRVTKVEFFHQEKSIGDAKQTGKDRYELTIKDLSYGPHWLTAVATDDQGRQNYSRVHVGFFVNGQALVEVTNPKPGALIARSPGSVTVKLRASDPNGGIKGVTVSLFEQGGVGIGAAQEGAAVGKDLYEAKFEAIPCMQRCSVKVTVTDNAGVETLSTPVDFKVTYPPHVSLYRHEGEYATELKDGMSLESTSGFGIIAKAGSFMGSEENIAKVDFYANEKLICTDVNSKATRTYYPRGDFRCALSNLPPGKYKLVAVATDNGGVEGKSAAIEVVIR